MAEIKISELSIGDWVNQKMNDGAYQVQWCEREMVGLIKHTGTEEDGSIRLTAVPLSFIEPIPLTSEILEKNGISKTYESDEYAVYKGEGFNVTEYYTELWEFERHRNRLMIRNVHQLQHALRLAGVEKEIEV